MAWSSLAGVNQDSKFDPRINRNDQVRLAVAIEVGGGDSAVGTGFVACSYTVVGARAK